MLHWDYFVWSFLEFFTFYLEKIFLFYTIVIREKEYGKECKGKLLGSIGKTLSLNIRNAWSRSFCTLDWFKLQLCSLRWLHTKPDRQTGVTSFFLSSLPLVLCPMKFCASPERFTVSTTYAHARSPVLVNRRVYTNPVWKASLLGLCSTQHETNAWTRVCVR